MSIYLGTQRLATNIAGDRILDYVTENAVTTSVVRLTSGTFSNTLGASTFNLSAGPAILPGTTFTFSGVEYTIIEGEGVTTIFTQVDISPALQSTIPSNTSLTLFEPKVTTISSNLAIPFLPNNSEGLSDGDLYSSGGVLQIVGSIGSNPQLVLQSKPNSSSESPDFVLRTRTGNPQTGRELGLVRWESSDGSGDNDDMFDYAEIWAESPNVGDGTEEGAVYLDLAHEGNQANSNRIEATYGFRLTGMKIPHRTGTLASPPADLVIGEVWADTTTSSQYPILRTRA